jgi:hypothetical protein
MSKTTKIIIIFNKQLIDFTNEILRVYPDNVKNNKDVVALYNTLLTATSLTPKIPIKIFETQLLLPYTNEMRQRNDDFFLNMNLKKSPIRILQYIYTTASDTNKTVIWNYIDRLRLLCQKYIEYKQHNNN